MIESIELLSVEYATSGVFLASQDDESDYVRDTSIRVLDEEAEDPLVASCRIADVRLDLIMNHSQAPHPHDVMDAHSQELFECIPILRQLSWCTRLFRLLDLRVAPDHRNAGIGSKVVARIIEDLGDEFTCFIVNPRPILTDFFGESVAEVEGRPETDEDLFADPRYRDAQEKLQRFYRRAGFQMHPSGMMIRLGDTVELDNGENTHA